MTSAFAPDHAALLDGPDWLRTHRVAAAERFATLELPTVDREEWRYSRIGAVDVGEYAPRSSATTIEVSDEVAERGATVGRLADSEELHDDLRSVISDGDDAFAALNEAFADDPIVIDVPAGIVLDDPIVVTHNVEAAGAQFPRVFVRLADNAQATVVELSSGGDASALVVPITHLDVGRAARLRHVSVQALGPDTVQLGHSISRVAQEGSVEIAHAALGGSYARLRFDCRLEGRGATGRLQALYFADGDQMHDLRTFQEHVGQDTTSDLVFKGAVDDRSHAVYTGLIRIDPGARGSNATQTNRIVKLSEDAWAESVPNLEIENNDVRCAHASAVGPIDADQRFYLESRGVPPAAAERLVVSGFFEEILSSFGIDPVSDDVRRHVAARLGRVR